MENTEKLIKNADEAASKLRSHSIGLPGGAAQVEDNFKKKLPVQVIKSGLAQFEKDLAPFQKDLQEAGKTEKELASRIKLKNALEVFKTQKSLDAAKKSHAALVSQIKKSEADYKKLKGQLDVFKPLLTKVEKRWEDEAKLAALIDKTNQAAEKSTDELNGKLIYLPGCAQQLDDNFAKNVPAQAIESTLKLFEKEVLELGSKLTTADSIASSLDGFIKKEKAFEYQLALNSVAEAKKAKAALSEKYTKSKVLLGDLITRLKAYKTQLKNLAVKA